MKLKRFFSPTNPLGITQTPHNSAENRHLDKLLIIALFSVVYLFNMVSY
jgi:hypothetical protein